jgi:hypothetical protein
MPTSGLVLGNCGLFWNPFGLHCLSLSANPIAQTVSICNHHRTVISRQSPASSGITTVCLCSPFPSEHRRGVMLYSRVWNQISGTSKGKYLKAGHVRIKANAPKPSGTFALPQIFPAPTSSNLPHPALPSPWCMRTEYVRAIAMSRFPIRPPDAFCTQFINSHDSSVSWRSWEVCKPPDSSDLASSSAASDERGEGLEQKSSTRHMWSLHSLAPRVVPHPANPISVASVRAGLRVGRHHPAI